MLAPVSEAQLGEPELLALGIASWRRYPEFIAELESLAGFGTGYARCGSLMVARDADDLALLDRELRVRQQMRLQVERITAAACRELEPSLAPSIRAGMFAADDHSVDPRRLLRALLAACTASGVVLLPERARLVIDDRVRGVMIRGTRYDATSVVIAAGAETGRVEGLPEHLRGLVRPVKGQILRLAQAEPTLLRHIIRGAEGYIVPRADGEVVVGATVEERGFDEQITAGAVHQLLRHACELVPDAAELRFVEVSAGLRPGTRDNAPLIGRTDVDGLLMAAGHHRNGILLAPVTADSVSALATGDAPPVEAAAFSPLRFGGRSMVSA